MSDQPAFQPRELNEKAVFHNLRPYSDLTEAIGKAVKIIIDDDLIGISFSDSARKSDVDCFATQLQENLKRGTRFWSLTRIQHSDAGPENAEVCILYRYSKFYISATATAYYGKLANEPEGTSVLVFDNAKAAQKYKDAEGGDEVA